MKVYCILKTEDNSLFSVEAVLATQELAEEYVSLKKADYQNRLDPHWFGFSEHSNGFGIYGKNISCSTVGYRWQEVDWYKTARST